MQTYIVLLLILSIIGCAQSQNWAGTYTVATSCTPSTCCCVSGQSVVTAVSANIYGFTVDLSSSCGGIPSYAGNVSIPAGTNVVNFTIPGVITFTFTLSSNSLAINVTNPAFSQCVAYLTKNGTAINVTVTYFNGTNATGFTLWSFANSISKSNIWLLFIMTLIGLMASVRPM